MDNKNVLVQIFEKYPDIWLDNKRFKALLADYLPEDKLKRNLIMMCIEECIPNEIMQKDTVSKTDHLRYRKRLINACGCSDVLSEEIISIWVEAFGKQEVVKVELTEDSLFSDIDAMPPNLLRTLNRAGVYKISDLREKSPIRNLGRKQLELLLTILRDAGVKLQPASNDEEIESSEDYLNLTLDDLELGVRQYHCLKRAGVETVKDILNLSGKEFISVRNFGYTSASRVLDALERVGVPFEKMGHLIFAHRNRSIINPEEQKFYISVEDNKLSIEEQINDAIQRGAECMQKEDCIGFVREWEAAVQLGYKGNYSILGTVYTTGYCNLKQDVKKGLQWLGKFYKAYKSNQLELDENFYIADVCRGLSVATLLDIEQTDYSEEEQRIKLDECISYVKEAIDFAVNDLVEREADDVDNLVAMGVCFAKGVISTDGSKEYSIETNYEYAYKAFKKAVSLGSDDAKNYISEMVEKGYITEET